MKLSILINILFVGLSLSAQENNSKKIFFEFEGIASADYQFYFEKPLYTGQERHYISAAFEPNFYLDWKGGTRRLEITIFGRLDLHDRNKSHLDIREAYWQVLDDKWELSLGAKKVYWGVTEIVHLVDAINQTDEVEGFDGEDKLGQPMAQFTYLTDKIGSFDIFYLPFHRKRTFAGESGRFRAPVAFEHEVQYESDLKQWHPGAAIRWSHNIGVADIGLSHYYGPTREPQILLDFSTSQFKLIPFYNLINQTGLDLQITHHSVLWKLEWIGNFNKQQQYTAFDVGIEYTLGNIKSSGKDLGLLAEYLYDSRGELTGFDNDIFIGGRLAFNDVADTYILGGALMDVEQQSFLISLEAARRIKDSWKVEFETRVLLNSKEEEISYSVRDDSFLKLSIYKYF